MRDNLMRVFCKECDEFHDAEEVKFLNIEEDFMGRYYMTFECQFANTEQKSHVVG